MGGASVYDISVNSIRRGDISDAVYLHPETPDEYFLPEAFCHKGTDNGLLQPGG